MKLRGTKEIEVEILEPTLKRFEEFKSHLETLKAQVDARGELARIKAIAKILQKYPELLDMVDYGGTFKQEKILERAREIVKNKDIPEDEAIGIVLKQFQQRIALIASEDVEVANALYFPDLMYPMNAESVRVAKDVIRATVDRTKLTKNDCKTLDGDEFWDEVEWKGVAEYANNFRNLYQ